MKNAQPTSWDKGIKEGRLDFTTPPPKSETHTHAHDHSSSIYARSLKTHNLAHTHTRTHETQHTQSQQKKTATWTRYSTRFHKVTEPAN